MRFNLREDQISYIVDTAVQNVSAGNLSEHLTNEQIIQIIKTSIYESLKTFNASQESAIRDEQRTKF